jgi:predicted tellurium resistance membrane protein TerC
MHLLPPDDGLQMGPKHVEAWWFNKVKINSASCWLLYKYKFKIHILHSQPNIKYTKISETQQRNSVTVWGVLTAVLLKIWVFWNVTLLCCLVCVVCTFAMALWPLRTSDNAHPTTTVMSHKTRIFRPCLKVLKNTHVEGRTLKNKSENYHGIKWTTKTCDVFIVIVIVIL